MACAPIPGNAMHPMSVSLSFKHFIWYHFEHIQHLIMLFVFETLQFVVQNFTSLFFLSFFDFLSLLTDASVPSVAGASDCCVRSALSVASGYEPVLLCAADMAAGALARIESLAVATAAELLSQSMQSNIQHILWKSNSWDLHDRDAHNSYYHHSKFDRPLCRISIGNCDNFGKLRQSNHSLGACALGLFVMHTRYKIHYVNQLVSSMRFWITADFLYPILYLSHDTHCQVLTDDITWHNWCVPLILHVLWYIKHFNSMRPRVSEEKPSIIHIKCLMDYALSKTHVDV